MIVAVLPLRTGVSTAQVAMRRLGVLMGFDESGSLRSRLKACLDALERLGWKSGRNLQVDIRWGAVDTQKGEMLARELLALHPDAVVAAGSPAALPLAQLTKQVPIVFTSVADPLTVGLVTGLSHPGGNVTGFGHYEPAIAAKWLQLLKEAFPTIGQAYAMVSPGNPASTVYLRGLEEGSAAVGIRVISVTVVDDSELRQAVRTAAIAGAGFLVLPSPIAQQHRELLIKLTIEHRVPAIFAFPEFVEDGGLMSYGVDSFELYRQAAGYVDRIFKGEKPGDLPVQGPTHFTFAINARTARTIGMVLPSSLLARADEVIE